MKKHSTLITLLIILAITIIFANIFDNEKPKQTITKREFGVVKKLPKPPVQYHALGSFVMSRGDFGIKIKTSKHMTKDRINKLIDYFRLYGVKNIDGKIYEFPENVTDGGLRMIEIEIPFPKSSKVKYQTMYVLKNEIKDL